MFVVFCNLWSVAKLKQIGPQRIPIRFTHPFIYPTIQLLHLSPTNIFLITVRRLLMLFVPDCCRSYLRLNSDFITANIEIFNIYL